MKKLAVPKMEKNVKTTRYGSTHWISPLDLKFTHDTVKIRFKPFMNADGRYHKSKSILESMQELLDCKSKNQVPTELDCLEACWADNDELYVAGTGNRRLTMWRLLRLYKEHEWSRIKVKIVNKDHPKVKFEQKNTTPCYGRWVMVRPEGKKDK